MGISANMAFLTPLLPDYVQKQSMGLAAGFFQFSCSLGFLFAGSGLFEIQNLIPSHDPKYIYFGLGGTFILYGFSMIFTVKDVIVENLHIESG